MRYFATFFHQRDGEWKEPLGSFRIIRLDGRLNLENMREVARVESLRRNYAGYQIIRGQSLLDSMTALTPITRSIP